MPGTMNVATLTVLPSLSMFSLPKTNPKITRNMTGNTTVKKVAAGLRRKLSRAYFAALKVLAIIGRCLRR